MSTRRKFDLPRGRPFRAGDPRTVAASRKGTRVLKQKAAMRRRVVKRTQIV